MAKREGISQKVRFEVFKRDSFKCQYCGKGAPDVTLHVDHIKPVAGGGDNSIMNLLTSCAECNSGKGAKPLDDQSEIEKQRRQLEELNERRLQLEMMLQWREGLSDLMGRQVEEVEKKFCLACGDNFSDYGKKMVRGWVKKYGLNAVLDMAEDSAKYLKKDKRGNFTQESITKYFDMIGRMCEVQKQCEGKPYLRDLLYIRGILRNRLGGNFNPHEALKFLEDAYQDGVPIHDIKSLAMSAISWTDFRNNIWNLFGRADDL